MYLLDTNICIGLMKGVPELERKIRSLRPSSMIVSHWVAKNLKVLEVFLEPFLSLPFDDRAARQYGMIRSLLERLGQPIGPNDLLIAAIGMVHDLTVVTRNDWEFTRVGKSYFGSRGTSK